MINNYYFGHISVKFLHVRVTEFRRENLCMILYNLYTYTCENENEFTIE